MVKKTMDYQWINKNAWIINYYFQIVNNTEQGKFVKDVFRDLLLMKTNVLKMIFSLDVLRL